MKGKVVAVLLCVLLLFAGCVDVESYLQPPRSQGQQQAVQDALEAALQQDGETGGGYILKYPTGGSISSAFLLLDASGSPTQTDDAVTAVAFYASATGERTHIHLLRRAETGWYSVADTEGEATDPHKVTLGDLDGDGSAELLVGWELYSSDYQLSIYQLDGTLQKTADAGRYTEYFVGDMDANGADEFLLLHIGNTVTASLCRWTADGTAVMGSASLNKNIRSFENLQFSKLSSGADGLYADVLLDSGNYATELLYWNGSRLLAPIGSRIAARTPYITATDVDGNGVPEIPVTTRLTGADVATEESWQWLTEWYSWDVTADTAVRQMGGIVNTLDGYCVELEEAWLDTVTARYDTDTRILWLEQPTDAGGSQPFLAIQNAEASSQAAEDAYEFETLPGSLPLRIWYAAEEPYHLTLEKISYMLVVL